MKCSIQSIIYHTCGQPAYLAAGFVIFPHESATHGRSFFVCWRCSAYREARDGAAWLPLIIKGHGRTGTFASRKICWKKHSSRHWQTLIGQDVLEYWPFEKKYRFRGETRTGDPELFVRNLKVHDDNGNERND